MSNAADTPLKIRPRVWWLRALRLHLQGVPQKEIARQCDVTDRTLRNFFATEHAQRELRELTDSITIASGHDSVSTKIKKALPKAIEKLITKLDCGDDKVEFLAACRLLDNAGFAPVKRVHVTEEERLRELSPAELRHFAETGNLPARMTTMIGVAEAHADDDSRD